MTVKTVASILFVGFSVVACYARVESGPGPGGGHAEEHCRNVAVHNKHDVEVCHSHCNDEGCRTQCREHERVARERRCWVD